MAISNSLVSIVLDYLPLLVIEQIGTTGCSNATVGLVLLLGGLIRRGIHSHLLPVLIGCVAQTYRHGQW